MECERSMDYVNVFKEGHLKSIQEIKNEMNVRE